jgi:hypothetical protein
MNSHYLIVLIAFLLGQALMTSIMVYFYQKEKNIKYHQALYTYMSAEVGYFIVGFITVLCLCFILSDFIDLSLTKEDLRSLKSRSWKENLQLYFKTSSFVAGCFAQAIAFKYREKGKKAVDNVGDKLVP